MNIIYHVTTIPEWAKALQDGYYQAPSLETEGFIHCSKAEQVQGVLERFFKGKTNLIKLTIDTAKLTNRLAFDYSASLKETFPHIYGTINPDAVIHTELL